jgi:chloramphenicol 3-O-phosphotransferase
MGAHAPYITAVDLSQVLWLGGGRGTGKSSIARALSQRFDLQLYTVDDHDQAHEPRLPGAYRPGSPGEASSAELLERFVTRSRHRFRLVLEDLAALPAAPLAIVEGAQLFPTSVAAVLRDPRHALFLLPDVDAERAATFDVRIAQRFAWEARDLRLVTLIVDAPIDEMVERAAAHFLPVVRRFGSAPE